MRILLVGNYEFNYQQSMQRFARLMELGLREAGHEVRLIRPSPVFGRLRPGDQGIPKWLGYFDKFVIFPFLLKRAAAWADIVHVCDHANSMYVSNTGQTPCVLTCHDVLAIRAAAGEIELSKPGFTGKLLQRWILAGLKRCTSIACVSNQTARELSPLIGRALSGLYVVPNAINYPYVSMSEDMAIDSLRRYDANNLRPYFLHVGGNQWYKNRLGLVRIFIELARKDHFSRHKLVMIGKPWTPEIRSLVHESGLSQKIIELTDLDNEALNAFYCLADALIFPSLYEGFGWPVIEAQACGIPVVTSNSAPMNEIAGAAGILIDPANEKMAAEIIEAALSGDLESIKNASIENASKYSVTAMIDGYIAIYKAACASNKPKIS